MDEKNKNLHSDNINTIVKCFIETGNTTYLEYIIKHYEPHIDKSIDKYFSEFNDYDKEDIKYEIINRIIEFCNNLHSKYNESKFQFDPDKLYLKFYRVIKTKIDQIRNHLENKTLHTISLEEKINEMHTEARQNGISDPDLIDKLFHNNPNIEDEYKNKALLLTKILTLLEEAGEEYNKNHKYDALDIFYQSRGINIQQLEATNQNQTYYQIAQKYNISRARAAEIVNKFQEFAFDYICKKLIEEEKEHEEEPDKPEEKINYLEYLKLIKNNKKRKSYENRIPPEKTHPLFFNRSEKY